jgi:DNA-binding IclR family transcriptional regulator
MRPIDDDQARTIGRVFADPAAVCTIDEIADRFGLTLSEAIRAMSDLEAIGIVRRIGDEYVPGVGAATAS